MKRRSLPMILVVILAVLAVFLFLPGAKAKRIEQADKKVQQEIAPQGGRLATEAEVKLIQASKNFRCQRVEGAPTIYLFMPDFNVNIALIARAGVMPSLDGFNLFIAPCASKDSPTTEKALGMCLVNTPSWNANKLRAAAGNIRPAMAEIDKVWKSLTTEQQKEVQEAEKANSLLVKDLGGLSIAVMVNDRAYLMKDWTSASNLRSILDTLNQR